MIRTRTTTASNLSATIMPIMAGYTAEAIIGRLVWVITSK